jgi:hypothetical protein
MDGPLAAACADYRRKLPWASVAELRGRQEHDAKELGRNSDDWAGSAAVAMYRCEVDSHGVIGFAALAGDARNRLRSESPRRAT